MKRLLCALLIPGLLLAAKAHLYNLKTGEVLEMKFNRWTSNRKITMTLANGTVLTGEYSTVPDGAVAWGTIYGSVWGTSGYASGSGNRIGVSRRGLQHGAAVLAGGGVTFDCEYVSSALNGHGTGACRDNSGQDWKLMF